MTVVRRFAEPLHSFTMICGKARFALPVRQTDSLLRIGITMVGRHTEPFEGLSDIGVHAAPALEQNGVVIFSERITPVGSATQPLRAFRRVLRGALSLEEHKAEPRLRLGDALPSRFAIPFNC